MAKRKEEKNNGAVIAAITGVGGALIGAVASIAADKRWGVNDKIKASKKDKKKDK